MLGVESPRTGLGSVSLSKKKPYPLTVACGWKRARSGELRTAKQAPQNGNHRQTVVYVGTIGRPDGVDLLLESAKYILHEKRREDVRFLIIGSGSELPRPNPTAALLSFNGHFEFAGRIEHQQVDGYLATSDVFVAPDPLNSFTDNCSMIKIFEYMAHGKPTVLFDLKEGRRAARLGCLCAPRTIRRISPNRL